MVVRTFILFKSVMISLTKGSRFLAPLLRKCTARTSTSIAGSDEYTDEPQYPEILDMSYEAKRRRKEHEWYEAIRKVKTVEEKLIKINMPKYYGWRAMMIHEDFFPYDPMPFVQHCTRTHFICQQSLPNFYLAYQSAAERFAAEIKDEIQDCLVFEHNIKQDFGAPHRFKTVEDQQEDANTYSLVKQINRIIMNRLSHSCDHLSTVQVDLKPRHESFWFVGGMQSSHHVIRSRKGYKWMNEEGIHEPADRPIQFLGKPLLTVRSSLPLEPLVPYSDASNPDYQVPKYTYSPETAGFTKIFRHGTNIPGFWPGDPDEFGLLNFRSRSHILSRSKSFGEQDNIESLHAQAMIASYGWLLSLSCYQGFSPYNDITYPTVMQTVITNGQYWSFYSYQLNTTALHREFIEDNPLKNICYGTNPLKLYESIEDGKIVGFNDEVLKMLLQFYANEPKARLNINMKPYLGEHEQVIADIDDDERRNWLEGIFKHLVSNRPRHRPLYEVYHWEKYYKIDHNTRPMDAKKRPFELHIDPFKRRLDEHPPVYVPKCIRPGGKKNRAGMFQKTYYP